MKTLCKIRSLCRAITAFEKEMERVCHLSLNEGMLLCILSNEKLMTSGEIAEALDLTPSNTSKIIRSLEQKGFLHRDLGNQDKRQMYFSLTDAGTRQLDVIHSDELQIPDLLK